MLYEIIIGHRTFADDAQHERGCFRTPGNHVQCSAGLQVNCTRYYGKLCGRVQNETIKCRYNYVTKHECYQVAVERLGEKMNLACGTEGRTSAVNQEKWSGKRMYIETNKKHDDESQHLKRARPCRWTIGLLFLATGVFKLTKKGIHGLLIIIRNGGLLRASNL